MRAGEPTGGDLITQPPVEHAVSLLHKKVNDSDSALPRAAEFLLLLASLSKAFQMHFLKQKETGVITSIQTTVPDFLGTADLQMPATYCHRWKIQFPK